MQQHENERKKYVLSRYGAFFITISQRAQSKCSAK